MFRSIYYFFTTFKVKDMLKYAREIKNQKRQESFQNQGNTQKIRSF